MKPLPFDMTPLARSLSMVPASSPSSTSVREADPTLPDQTEAVTMDPSESSSASQRALDENTGFRGDAASGPIASGESDSVAQPVQKGRKPRRERKAERNAKQHATPGAPSQVPAERPQSTPTTELRRALYPAHVCSGKSWAGRLADEQIHALATHVLARHTQQNLRTLAITSALAGEGKTTATLALAQKLAGADKRVLIMDLDTHRATLSHEAGLDDAAGALQSCDPNDISNLEFHAYETDVPGVTIMPVGHQPVGLTGPPLVSPVHTGVLVLNALERFDIVILDCPPLLPVAETFVLREVVDAAIMVVRAGSTPRDMLDQAIDDFGREKFMGAILNRTKPGDIPYFREVYGYYRRDSIRG